MEPPESTIESIQTLDDGTVHTYRFDWEGSFARGSKGPDLSDDTTPLSIDVTEGDEPDMLDLRVRVRNDAQDGLPAKSEMIAVFCEQVEPQDEFCEVSIQSSYNWRSTVDLISRATEQEPHNRLLKASYDFAVKRASHKRSPAEKQNWARVLAIYYSGEELSHEETERLRTNDIEVLRVETFLAHTYSSLKDDQCVKGARAVLAVDGEAYHLQTLVNLAEEILENPTTTIAPQQDDHEENISAGNGDI